MRLPTFSIRYTIWLALLLLCMPAFVGCTEEPEPPSVMSPQTREYLMRGTQALRQYEFARALALVDSAETIAPNETGVEFLRARIYTEIHKYEKAQTIYAQVAERNPDYPGVWNNLGNLKARQGLYRQALGYYYKELAHHPAPIPWVAIGDAYRELGVPDSAAYAFKQALALDSTYALAYASLAQLLNDEGKFESALNYARQALELVPANLDAHYLVGVLLMKMGRFDDALPYLRAVVEAQPWHRGAHYNLGQALIRSGNREEGVAYVERSEVLRELDAQINRLQRTVNASPEDPYAYAGLGSALRRVHRYDAAMRAYKVALHLDPHNQEILNNVAALHLLRKDTTAAINTYRMILQHDSTFVDVWLNLGVLYAISGKKDAARRAWRQVLVYEPGNKNALAYLARLERGS